MFYEQRTSVPDEPADLRAAYDDELADLVDDVGVATASSATGLDRESLEALQNGASPDISLEDAAAIVALDDDAPDPDTIVVEACEYLLLGMSTAVLDVETLASHLEIDLEPKEIQQKIERRAPMTFDEFVHVQHTVVDRTP